MAELKNETGKKYGRWTVLERGKNAGSAATWLCKCDCGNQAVVRGAHLRSGNTRSCGCLHREIVAKSARTHGQRGLPEYGSWDHMIQRCTNPNNNKFADYGGRGIKVCQIWRDSFEAFYQDLGPRPSPGYSLDRIDNNGNYEPGNCRWATQRQQCHNTRSNRNFMHNGETLCLAAWARKVGINYNTLRSRLRCGWSVNKTLITPVKGRAGT